MAIRVSQVVLQVLHQGKSSLEGIVGVGDYDHSYTAYDGSVDSTCLVEIGTTLEARMLTGTYFLAGFEQAETVAVPPRADQSVYFRYIVQVGDADAWIERMLDKGVDCKQPVYRPLHQYLGLDAAEYPNTERAHRHNVSIPIYPSLGEREIECIIRAGMAC